MACRRKRGARHLSDDRRRQLRRKGRGAQRIGDCESKRLVGIRREPRGRPTSARSIPASICGTSISARPRPVRKPGRGRISGGSVYPTYNSPAETENGGINFNITPPDALVYVDNRYVGVASSFSTSQPLWLAAGSHRIELLATGFAPVSLEVNVVAGQVIPCSVSLTPTSDR